VDTSKPRVAAVVPAYNEEKRISAALAAIEEAELVDEIIVVSDGSVDKTYEIAASNPLVKAIRLEYNRGKAGAMLEGAGATEAEIVLFLDADLIGLKGDHVDDLIRPVLFGDADMAIGVFRAGRRITDLAQILVPYISGQRAIYRNLFLSIPHLADLRSGVEMAITRYFKATGLMVEHVVLSGVTHPMKEEKLGFFRGFAARLRMYREIAHVLMNGRAIVVSKRVDRPANTSEDRS